VHELEVIERSLKAVKVLGAFSTMKRTSWAMLLQLVDVRLAPCLRLLHDDLPSVLPN
jgi:hypothetical protein